MNFFSEFKDLLPFLLVLGVLLYFVYRNWGGRFFALKNRGFSKKKALPEEMTRFTNQSLRPHKIGAIFSGSAHGDWDESSWLLEFYPTDLGASLTDGGEGVRYLLTWPYSNQDMPHFAITAEWKGCSYDNVSSGSNVTFDRLGMTQLPEDLQPFLETQTLNRHATILYCSKEIDLRDFVPADIIQALVNSEPHMSLFCFDGRFGLVSGWTPRGKLELIFQLADKIKSEFRSDA